jgi:hypothetical protein
MSSAGDGRLSRQLLQEACVLARPPTPPSSHGAGTSASVVGLPRAMRRADVPAVVALGRQAATVRRAQQVTADAGAVSSPSLPVVDAICRLALDARRDHRAFRLEHASPALLELLELCGLRKIVTGGDGPGGSDDEAT